MRLGWLLVCGACGRIAFDPTGASGDATPGDDAPTAPAVPSVQRGLLTVADGQSTTNTTITPVDPARALLVHSHGIDHEGASGGLVRADLIDGNTVELQRVGTMSRVDAAYHVVTWSGWSVQRGGVQIPPNETELLVPLSPPVDRSRAFAIATQTTVGSSIDEDDMLIVELASDNSLRLALSNDGANVTDVSWQVVEIPTARVIAGTASFTAGVTDVNATTAAFDPSRSFLVYSFGAQDLSGSASPYALRGNILDGTTVEFHRSLAGGVSLDVSFVIVELGGGRVASDVELFAVGSLTHGVFVDGFDPAVAFPLGGGYAGKGGSSPFNGNNNQGNAWARMQLSSANTLEIERRLGSNGADIPWQLIELATD